MGEALRRARARTRAELRAGARRSAGHVACVSSIMHPSNHSRNFRVREDYSPGWRQERRDAINDDVAPDDVALLGPPTRQPHSPEALGAYGYAGQGYPIYGQPGREGSDASAEPIWFADPTSGAYAFGYTSSVRSSYDPDARSLRGHAGKGPKGHFRADVRVREDVCDRLSVDDEVDASDISVSVSGGEVLLEGSVPDRYMKRRAEGLAASVRGALDVHNHLRVHKGLLRELGDKLTGTGDEEHHGHQGSGTRPPPA